MHLVFDEIKDNHHMPIRDDEIKQFEWLAWFLHKKIEISIKIGI